MQDDRYAHDKQNLVENFQDSYNLILNTTIDRNGRIRFIDQGDAAWRTGLIAVVLILEGDYDAANRYLIALRDNCWDHEAPLRYPTGPASRNPLSRDQFIPQMLACLLSYTRTRNAALQQTAGQLMSKFIRCITTNHMQLSSHDAGYLPYSLQYLTHRVAEILELPIFYPSIKIELDNIRGRDRNRLRDKIRNGISSSLNALSVKIKVFGRWFTIGIPKNIRDKCAATITDHIIMGNLFKAVGGLAAVIDASGQRRGGESVKDWLNRGLRKDISDAIHDECRFEYTFRVGRFKKTVTIGPSRGDCNTVTGVIANAIASTLLEMNLPSPSNFKLGDFLDAVSDSHPLFAIYSLYTHITAERIESYDPAKKIDEYYQVHLLFCQLFMLRESNRSFFANRMGNSVQRLARATSRHNMALIDILSAQTEEADVRERLRHRTVRTYIHGWNTDWENADYVWQQDLHSQKRDRNRTDRQIVPLAYMMMKALHFELFHEAALRIRSTYNLRRIHHGPFFRSVSRSNLLGLRRTRDEIEEDTHRNVTRRLE